MADEPITDEPITDERIEMLQRGAHANGDLDTVEVCKRALGGDFLARLQCEQIVYQLELKAREI